jgi:hypothetical protein
MNSPTSTSIEILEVDKNKSKEISGVKYFIFKLKNRVGQEEQSYIDSMERDASSKKILNLKIDRDGKTLSYDIPSSINSQEALDTIKGYIEQANLKKSNFHTELDNLKF